MPLYDNIEGVGREVTRLYDNIEGGLREVTKAYDNIEGGLREYFSSGIDVTKVSSIDLRFHSFGRQQRKAATGGNYASTVQVYQAGAYGVTMQARSEKHRNSETGLGIQGLAVPVLVLKDGQRVVMAGGDVVEGVYYSGVNATGARISQNSGIYLTGTGSTWVNSTQSYPHGSVQFINGIFGEGQPSIAWVNEWASDSGAILQGGREIYHVYTYYDSSDFWSGESGTIAWLADIGMVAKNLFTGEGIPMISSKSPSIRSSAYTEASETSTAWKWEYQFDTYSRNY